MRQRHPAPLLLLGLTARPWLLKGLEDVDPVCQGMAAWALSQLPPDLMDAPALRRLAEAGNTAPCELFDGEDVYEKTASQIAADALEGKLK